MASETFRFEIFDSNGIVVVVDGVVEGVEIGGKEVFVISFVVFLDEIRSKINKLEN